MNRDELRLRADMGWRGGDADTLLRRLELGPKSAPNFRSTGRRKPASPCSLKHPEIKTDFSSGRGAFRSGQPTVASPSHGGICAMRCLPHGFDPRQSLNSAGRTPNARLEAESLAEQSIFAVCGSRGEADATPRRS